MTDEEEIAMVSSARQNLVFRATNIHAAGCGEPPAITNSDPGRYYLGYFEGGCGDQWVFVYDRQTGSGALRGGDIGWDEEELVEDGRAGDLVLGREEQLWLQACWLAATGETPTRPSAGAN